MTKYLTPFYKMDSIFDEFFNNNSLLSNRGLSKWSGNYNIVRVSDSVYQIVLNVAGFNREDIEILQEGDLLTIKGNVSASNNQDNYIYQGFSSSFQNSFSIGENADILGAEIKDGILKIDIKDNKIIAKQPKKISIR